MTKAINFKSKSISNFKYQSSKKQWKDPQQVKKLNIGGFNMSMIHMGDLRKSHKVGSLANMIESSSSESDNKNNESIQNVDDNYNFDLDFRNFGEDDWLNKNINI